MDGRKSPPSASDAITSTILERQSLTLGIVSLALAFVFYLVAKELVVPAWVLCCCLIGWSISVWILIAAVRRIALDSVISLPSLLAVIKDQSEPTLPILLLEPNDLFGISTAVSVYHRDSQTDYEVLIAHGVVRTIQGDKKIQVKIDEWIEGNNDIVEQVKSQTSGVLSRVVVRPYSAGNNPSFHRKNVSQPDVTAIQAYLLQEWAKQPNTNQDPAND